MRLVERDGRLECEFCGGPRFEYSDQDQVLVHIFGKAGIAQGHTMHCPYYKEDEPGRLDWTGVNQVQLQVRLEHRPPPQAGLPEPPGCLGGSGPYLLG